MERRFNMKVWKDTLQRINQYPRPPSAPSVKYNFDILRRELPESTYWGKLNVQVLNADTFDIAHGAILSGQNPLILNMANHVHPGGGVSSGARAQEECLFRRSNYANTLTKQLYPLKDNEIIYSPVVSVIKDSGYSLSDRWECACIAVAALRKSPYDAPKYTPLEYEQMTQKIRMIFRVAIMHGHDSLVLGAFGCGAFNNPPIEVCNIMESVILEHQGYFQDIYFAVLSDDDNPNYDIFKTLELLN